MERMIKKEYAQVLIGILEKAIKEEQEMWNSNKSHPYIIGTLLGTIKALKSELYIASGLYKDNEQNNDND